MKLSLCNNHPSPLSSKKRRESVHVVISSTKLRDQCTMLRLRSSYQDAAGVKRLTKLGVKRRREPPLPGRRRVDQLIQSHHWIPLFVLPSSSFRPNRPICYTLSHNQLKTNRISSVLHGERLFSTSTTVEPMSHSTESNHTLASTKTLQSLDEMDWKEVSQILKTLLGDLKKNAPLEKVKLAFALLDRLNQEAASYYDVVDQPKEMIRLDGPLLTMALTAWRSAVVNELKISFKRYADQPRVSGRRKVLDKLDHENMSPQQVLDRVKDYLHTKLFSINPRFFNIIISVVGKVEERDKAPFAADTIFEEMIRQNRKSYPCDSVTITELVRIWAISKLPESATRAEVYLKSLQDWQMETQRTSMDPNPELFCLVMEAHANTNPPNMALPRILELYSEMKEATHITRSPKQTALSMARVASSMANCQGHPQSIVAAKAVVEDFCEAFLEKHGWRQIDELFGAMEGASLPEEQRLLLMFHTLKCLSDSFRGELESDGESGFLSDRKLGTLLARWKDHSRSKHEGKKSPAGGFHVPQSLGLGESFTPSRVFEYLKDCTDSRLSPGNAICHNMILNVTARLNDIDEPLKLGHSIFEHMLERSSSDLTHHEHPNRSTINELLSICAKSGSKEAQAQAEFYFDQLQNWHKASSRDDMKPEVKTYCALMDVYGSCSKQDPKGAVVTIQNLFSEMKERCEKYHIIAFSYARASLALARCHDPSAADAIRSLVDELCESYLQKKDTVLGKDLRPTQGLYASLILSYAKSGRFNDASDFIDQMDSIAAASNVPPLRVGKKVKEKLMSIKEHFAKAPKEEITQALSGASQESLWNKAESFLASLRDGNLSDIPERVEYMFEIMDRLCQEAELKMKSKDPPLRPLDRLLFGDMLKAWHEKAISQHSHQMTTVDGHIENIRWELSPSSMYRKIVRYLESGLIEPNPYYFNMLLRTVKVTEDRQRAPYAGHEIYQDLLSQASHDPRDRVWHPTKTTVQEMIDLWSLSRLPEAPERAEGYLSDLQRWSRQMESSESREYYSPDSRHYCSVMEAYSRSSTPEFAFRNIQHLYSEMKNETGIETIAFTRVCHALAACGTSEAADFARGILDSMCKDYFEAGIESSKPSQSTFNAVLKAYGKIGRLEDAKKLLLYMKDLAKKTGDPSWEPNDVNSSAIIWAHARVGDVEATKAEILELENGIDLHSLQPAAFNGLLSALAESGDSEAPGRISDMIQSLENPDRTASTKSTTSTYNSLLKAYGRQGTPAAAEAAQDLLFSMQSKSSPSPNPDQDSLTHCLQAWSDARKPDRADSLLRQMCEQVKLGQMPSSLLTQRQFSIVLSAWGESQEPSSVEKASSIFDLMKEMNLRPNTTTYNALLWANAKSPKHVDASAVEDLFLQMKTEWKKGGDFLKPNERSYEALLRSISHSSDSGTVSRGEKYIQDMESLGIKIDPALCATIIDFWARNGRIGQAEHVFQDMRQRLTEENESTADDWSVIHRHRFWGWFNQENPEMLHDCIKDWIADFDSGLIKEPPSSKEFGSSAHQLIGSGNPEAQQKVESLADKMFGLAENGSSRCIPNARLISTITSAYLRRRSPRAGIIALKLLTNQQKIALQHPDMPDIQPNLLSYSGTILSLIHAPTKGSELAIATLLDQLGQKGDEFWETRFRPVEILAKVKGALKSSSLASKYDLIAKCDSLPPLASMEEWLG